MQKQTSVYIPKPCHEDWNKMTPTRQGKFCASCNKQVVDFSLMSDNQILNFLSTQPGKLCGRFDAEQLQRPLVETKIKKKKSWWMALTMPLLFLFDRSHAQGTVAIIKPDTTVSPTFKQPDVMGKLVYQPLKQVTITGKVVDENNKPLAYASVVRKEFADGITTDSAGNFSLTINSVEENIILTASYIGYSSADTIFEATEKNISGVIIKLAVYKTTGLTDVVVTSRQQFTGRLGGAVAICTRISTYQKLDSSFKKLTGISNVYPNPAPKGSSIHLKLKNEGKYQMQLLDNQSRLMQTEEINADTKNSITKIQLPSNITSGMYYLRLINEQTKKQYTEILIIQ